MSESKSRKQAIMYANVEAPAMVERTLESYFVDWEGEVFGFGYGSGEPHTVPALRTFFVCVPPDDAKDRCYDYQLLENALTPTVAWLLMSALGKADIIEYGSSPRFGWLTPKGYRLRDFMLGKTPDELVALVTAFDQDQPHCGPRCCNCGPSGYEEGKDCPNPFYHDRPNEGRRG
jgi:hypothetical protein